MITTKDKLDINYAVKSDNITDYKQIDMTKRTVDLIANTYYYFDSDGDVLVPGVCKKSIQDRGPRSNKPGRIKHFWSHEPDEIIARCDLLEETEISGKSVLHANSFFPETSDSEEVLIKYQNGLLDQHSIGYRYLDIEFAEADTKTFDNMLSKLINPDEAINAGYMFIVKEIELFEYSTVAFGANRLTPYLGSKSENKTVQYNNLLSKMDALMEVLKTGSGDKDIARIKESQLKQMIYELINQEPTVKPPLPGPVKAVTFDVSKYLPLKILN